eukprot:403358757
MNRSATKRGQKEQAPAAEHNKELFTGRRALCVPLGRAFNHKRATEAERKFKNHGGTVVQLNSLNQDSFKDILRKTDYILTASGTQKSGGHLDMEKLSEILKLPNEEVSNFLSEEGKNIHVRWLEHHFIDECIRDNKIHHIKEFLIDVPKGEKGAKNLEEQKQEEALTPAKKSDQADSALVTPLASGSAKKRTRHQTSSDQKQKASTESKKVNRRGGDLSADDEMQATQFDENEAEIAAAGGTDYLKRKRAKITQNDVGVGGNEMIQASSQSAAAGSGSKLLQAGIKDSNQKQLIFDDVASEGAAAGQHPRHEFIEEVKGDIQGGGKLFNLITLTYLIKDDQHKYDQGVQTHEQLGVSKEEAEIVNQPIKDENIAATDPLIVTVVQEFENLSKDDFDKLEQVIDDIASKEIQQITNQVNEPLINFLDQAFKTFDISDMRRQLYQDVIDSIRVFNRGIFGVNDLMNLPNLTDNIIQDINNFFEDQTRSLIGQVDQVDKVADQLQTDQQQLQIEQDDQSKNQQLQENQGNEDLAQNFINEDNSKLNQNQDNSQQLQ